MKLYFKLTGVRPVHHIPRRIFSKHSECIGMELKVLVDVGIIFSASAFWSFFVFAASKKRTSKILHRLSLPISSYEGRSMAAFPH